MFFKKNLDYIDSINLREKHNKIKKRIKNRKKILKEALVFYADNSLENQLFDSGPSTMDPKDYSLNNGLGDNIFVIDREFPTFDEVRREFSESCCFLENMNDLLSMHYEEEPRFTSTLNPYEFNKSDTAVTVKKTFI